MMLKYSVVVGSLTALLSGCSFQAGDGVSLPDETSGAVAPGVAAQGKPAPPPVPTLDYSAYALVWNEEFDQAALDTLTWTPQIGNGTNGWGNNELEYYTDRPENVRLENGALVIEARKEAFGGFQYTSARISTQGNRSFGYGIIEARIKTPSGSGYWPAFWMLGDNLPQVGWPACGELDIMENKGTNNVYQYAHWFHDANGAQGDSGTISSADITQYHTYSIRRDANKMDWYIDGVLHHTLDITPASLSEFQQGFFVLLNLAVGGNFTGTPRRTTTFPQSMSVDWVRLWQ